MATLGVLPMKEETVTDALLREFLLGKLADEERERIESLFLTDPQTRERVLTQEEELTGDYLEDSLNEADRKRFLARYAQTDEQRRKLRVTKSIKDWAVAHARGPQRAATTVSVWDRLWTRLRLKPAFVVPIAVMIVIAIVLAIVWLNSYMELRKHLAVEQELAQLNSPATLRETPPDMISFELRPVTVRSVETQTELNLRADVQLVELRLPWIQKERYSRYQVELRRLGDDEVFTIPNLQAEKDSGYTIRVRLPAHILSRGSYRMQVKGIDNDSSASPAEEYQFAVSE
jgi:hypothetical protein